MYLGEANHLIAFDKQLFSSLNYYKFCQRSFVFYFYDEIYLTASNIASC